MRLTTTLRATTAVVALSLLTVACGSSTGSGTSTSSTTSSSTSSSSSTSASDTSSSGSSTPQAATSSPGGSTGSVAGSTDVGGSSGGGGGGGGTLTIWADDKGAPAMKQAAADFGSANGVTVNVQTISKDLQSTFVTAAQAGKSPDLVLGAHDWIGNLVQNGDIDPITMDATTQAKFNPLAIKGVTFNSQIYGVPFAVENIMLFRNTALAPNAPATLEDMVSTGQALVKSGKASNIMALPQGQNGDPYHLEPIFTAGGGAIFGTTSTGDYDPKNVLVDSAGSIAAGKMIAALGEKGSGALSRSITGDNVLSLFTTGKTPYIITGPWNLDAIKKSGIKYDISAIPGFASGGTAKPFIGVQTLYVAAKGPNKALAQEFATNYFATDDVAKALYQAYDRPPALLTAYNAVAANDPDIAKEAAAAKNGQILPSIPAMQSVWTPLGIAEAAIIGGADPTTTLQKAASTIRSAIK